MRILAIISGEYGQRHVQHVRERGPSEWAVEVWQAPSSLPAMIDDPEDFVPEDLPPADLILSCAQDPGVAELLPQVARVTGAKAVIASVDDEAWLPRGLARQVRGWLEKIGVACVTPKPICSLTDTDYGTGRGQRTEYTDPLLVQFARHFGRPALRITVDPQTRCVSSVEVERDSVCGSARHVAEGLIGLSAEDAEEKAGLLHHQHPCLASMTQDSDYGDTLMHVSGNVIKNDVAAAVKPFKKVQYIKPG